MPGSLVFEPQSHSRTHRQSLNPFWPIRMNRLGARLKRAFPQALRPEHKRI